MQRMTRIAPYDPERFTSAITHYIAGRPQYSPRLLAKLAAEAHLGPQSRVLDLGCGPGTLAIPFRRYCGTLIAMDIDPAMIAAARRAAHDSGVTIDLRVGSSFDLDTSLAPLDLVIMGRSFHWMDRAATLERLNELLAPGGAIALLETALHSYGENHWHTIFEDIRTRYSRLDDFNRWRKGEAFERHTSVLLRSQFSDVESMSTFDVRTPDIDALVARALSFSANSPAILGDDAAAYAAEMRAGLLAACPDGVFPEIVESTAIIARRPATP
ncbi:class I SAM-dependent methyltransferase [Hyphomicrobium sulfonivorans]|nr:class I SAM-dependent methyltransferase [Hyphomicrobium sulfonivorans]